ncbi:RES family NAD+ phosphorylase [Neotabrizicola sp. sgz301269]|uniref:RES family NAD+ phosphorylase n=1 Tax=Neotabrizicola sp. sgz301269 TaxID=3276282 RepID=UPI00376F8472
MAIAETIHHRARFMRATNEAPGWTSQFRELIGAIDANLDDATGRADLLDPCDYRASQVFGAERRAAGSNGITWPSIRIPEGHYIAIFWPDVIPIPTKGAHFAYHWNGAAVNFVKQLDSGEVMEVTRALGAFHASTSMSCISFETK